MSDKNRLVKYENDLNDVSFVGFSNLNYDIFMACVALIKNKGEQEITIPFSELKKICGIKKNATNDEVWKLARETGVKLQGLKIRFENETIFESFVLFPYFRADRDNKKLTFQVNSKFAYLLNDFTSFTQFELSQFTRLSSKYSKTLFRKLKQFACSGEYHVTIDEFKRLFDIPKSYTNMRILDKILKPAMLELEAYFDELRLEVHRASTQGAPITGYTFRFHGKGQIKGQMSIADYEVPKGQKEGYKKKVQAKKKKEESQKKLRNFEERKTDYAAIEQKLLKGE